MAGHHTLVRWRHGARLPHLARSTVGPAPGLVGVWHETPPARWEARRDAMPRPDAGRREGALFRWQGASDAGARPPRHRPGGRRSTTRRETARRRRRGNPVYLQRSSTTSIQRKVAVRHPVGTAPAVRRPAGATQLCDVRSARPNGGESDRRNAARRFRPTQPSRTASSWYGAAVQRPVGGVWWSFSRSGAARRRGALGRRHLGVFAAFEPGSKQKVGATGHETLHQRPFRRHTVVRGHRACCPLNCVFKGPRWPSPFLPSGCGFSFHRALGDGSNVWPAQSAGNLKGRPASPTWRACSRGPFSLWR